MSSSERSHRWRKLNPDRNRSSNRMHNRSKKERYRDYVRELKRAPCSDCGGTFDPVCMDFDHRLDEIKVAEISMFTAGFEALKQEIAKCDLVCANCHRLRTARRGQFGRRKKPAPLAAVLQLSLTIIRKE